MPAIHIDTKDVWLWTTSGGEKIAVPELTDRHLTNILGMLGRRGACPLEPTNEILEDILNDNHIPYDSDGMDDMGMIRAICAMQERDTRNVWYYVLREERDRRQGRGFFSDGGGI